MNVKLSGTQLKINDDSNCELRLGVIEIAITKYTKQITTIFIKKKKNIAKVTLHSSFIQINIKSKIGN